MSGIFIKNRFVNFVLIVALLDFNNGSLENELDRKRYFDNIINEVNNDEKATWKADHNYLTETMHESMTKYMAGSMEEKSHAENDDEVAVKCEHELVGHGNQSKSIKEFDGREVWSYCPSVKLVKNQGNCASDWALAPVSVISDRICIFSKGKDRVSLSPHDAISCCKTCGWGCKKGYPSMVYKQYTTKGIVTGGDYESKMGCQPYNIKPCKDDVRTCFTGGDFKTPSCHTDCYNRDYKTKYAEDFYKGSSRFSLRCPHCAGKELTTRGPLSATFTLYEDFLAYKSGIYHHVSGKRLGMLTVKIIGYNDTAEPNYWLAINSWGEKWGDEGTFKIRRGVNECMFEGSLRGATVEDG